MVSVADSVVVVTGGRRGLGAALVDELLDRGVSKVYSTARQSYSDPRSNVVTHPLEVTDDASVAEFVQRAGDAQILINNAGVAPAGSVLTGDFGDMVTAFDTNVFGPIRLTRAFAPVLSANGGGAVVNMLSILSWLAGAGAYGASKSALWSFTNSLRLELAPQGTQVLGVHASFIDTEMAAAIPAAKSSPAVVAHRIIDALEAGEAEVLTDADTVQAKAALTGPVERLTLDLGH